MKLHIPVRHCAAIAFSLCCCFLLFSCSNASSPDASSHHTNETTESAPAAAAPSLDTAMAIQNEGHEHTTMATAPHASDIPAFPWPVPKPSAAEQLPGSVFANCHTLGSAAAKIKAALDNCGYNRKSYFSIPDGFAMVTELEQFNRDGSSRPEPDRWNVSTRSRVFTLSDYLHSLFTARPGFYRCIVFLVTDVPYNTSAPAPSQAATQEWLDTGLNKLPAAIAALSTTPDYDYNVLIYEFKKPETANASQIASPSMLSAHTHLVKSRLLSALSRP